MCPFGALHGPRPSRCAWTLGGPQTRMHRTQIAPPQDRSGKWGCRRASPQRGSNGGSLSCAPRRYADDPRRGWGLQGAEFTGVVSGGLGTWPKGAFYPQARSAPKRALRSTEARLLAAKSCAGMKEPREPLAEPRRPLPRPPGPRENNRHTRPRGSRRVRPRHPRRRKRATS
jgi:hypothetical protein